MSDSRGPRTGSIPVVPFAQQIPYEPEVRRPWQNGFGQSLGLSWAESAEKKGFIGYGLPIHNSFFLTGPGRFFILRQTQFQRRNFQMP